LYLSIQHVRGLSVCRTCFVSQYSACAHCLLVFSKSYVSQYSACALCLLVFSKSFVSQYSAFATSLNILNMLVSQHSACAFCFQYSTHTVPYFSVISKFALPFSIYLLPCLIVLRNALSLSTVFLTYIVSQWSARALSLSMWNVLCISEFSMCLSLSILCMCCLLKGHGNNVDFLGFLHKPVQHRSITLRFEPF